jgi:hypothetical protein
MTSTRLLLLAFLIYPLIIIRLDSVVRRKIPDNLKRKAFKKEKEYIIKLVYLITPLLLFHVELLYLDAGYSLSEINLISLIVLFLFKIYLLIVAIYSLFKLFAELKNYGE